MATKSPVAAKSDFPRPCTTVDVLVFTVIADAAILRAGVERLRSKVEYTSLPAYLLPEPFTLPQLQRTYEIVLGRPVDKSGFHTRMMAADFLAEVGVVEGESNRPAMGYRLKDRATPVFFPRTFSPRG